MVYFLYDDRDGTGVPQNLRDKVIRKIAEYVGIPRVAGEPFERLTEAIYLMNSTDAVNNSIQEVQFTNGGNEIQLFPVFEPVQNQNHRLIFTGRSGSGKSTSVGHCLDQMTLDNGGKRIIIISFINEDPELDRPRYFNKRMIRPKRLHLSHRKGTDEYNELLSLTIDYFSDSIVIFDDVETCVNKELLNYIISLRDMMLEAGRHHGIDVLTISHDILAGHINKKVKAEATGVFMFPQYNQPHQTKEYLKKYVGLSEEQIIDCMDGDESRFVYINLIAPKYYVKAKSCKMLTIDWSLSKKKKK